MSVIRNTGHNLIAALVPTVVALVTLPLMIAAVGEARYGVIALVTALVGYFGVFDFGLSAATAQRIAAAGHDDLASRRAIFWTAAGVNLGMGLLAAILVAPAALWFFDQAHLLDPALMAEIRQSLPFIALALPVMLLGGVLRGALQGAGEFAALNRIAVVTGPLGQILPLLVAMYLSPRLPAVLAMLYAVRLVSLGWQAAIVALRVTQGWTPHFERDRVKDLLSFGGWVTVSALVDPLLTTIDRFLIGARLGMHVVSWYTVPQQLAQRSLIVPGALVEAMLPRVASGSEAEALAVSRRGLRAIVAIMTPPFLAGIAFVHPFLALWISPEFAANSALPAQFMLLGCWLNGLGYGCFQHLRARGRPRLIAIAHLIEIPPYLAVLLFAMSHFGLAGAAAAFAFRVLFDDLLLAGLGGLGRELVRLLALALPLLGLALWLGQRVQALPDLLTIPALVAVLLVLVAGCASLLWLWGERTTLRNAFGKA